MVVVGLVLYLTHPRGEEQAEPLPQAAPADDECCGMHQVCEKFGTTAETVYFDDYELDEFAGRGADGYSPEEIDRFRDVLYTLLPADVAPWGVSLQNRRIEMPEPLRQEWVMLVQEAIDKTKPQPTSSAS